MPIICTQVLAFATIVLGNRRPRSSRLDRRTVTRSSRERIAAATHHEMPPRSA